MVQSRTTMHTCNPILYLSLAGSLFRLWNSTHIQCMCHMFSNYLHVVSIATACTETEQVVSLDVFMYSMCYTVLKVCKCMTGHLSYQSMVCKYAEGIDTNLLVICERGEHSRTVLSHV